MRPNPLQLLRKLEPPVRPGGAPGSDRAGRAAFEAQSFDDLLGLVSTGAVHSGRAISVPPELRESLSDEQRARLADAADLAEAEGAQRALMLIDGRGVVMDVRGRAVTGELTAGAEAPVVPIDAAVFVAGDGDEAGAARLPWPGAGRVPPGVLAQLVTARAGQDGSQPEGMNRAGEARRAAG